MAKQNKKVDQIRQLYNLADSSTRRQWQQINQKGYEFAHDEQLAANEKDSLEEQGMPTFTINRILPVVEMLNFYATANNPRWQAIGVEGSDTNVAAVLSDLLTMYGIILMALPFILMPSMIQLLRALVIFLLL